MPNTERPMSARGNFSSKFGFIAAAAGTAVGLGNIWRFPFEVANGGGAAFLLIYLAFSLFLGIPIMLTEVAIGRRAQRDASGAFGVLGFKKWSFLGKIGILASVIGLSLYIVVAAWALGYVFELLRSNFSIGSQFGDYTKDVVKIGSYGIVFMIATGYIVSKGVSAGIEKASKVLMPSLLIMIVLLGTYALTLPNALQGISFYLIPNFSALRPAVIYTAMGQAFFSLTLGMAAHITYGSYVSKQDNIFASVTLITITDVTVAFLAGMMIFPFVSFITGGTMEGVSGGPGLIFETLPGVFESFGAILGPLVGVVFFLLLSFAALTSAVALLEVPVSYLVDGFQLKRIHAVLGMGVLILVLSLPSLAGFGFSEMMTNFIQYGSQDKPTEFMTFLIHINDIITISGGLLVSIFGAYVWGKKGLSSEIETGYPSYNGSIVQKLVNVMISYICPLLLSLLLTLTVLDRYFGIALL